MRLGVARPIRSIEDMVQWAKRAEEIGFDLIGLGDSQTMWMDPYVAMTLVAEHTSRVLLGPTVSNPITRHPTVSACGMATVQQLANGRAFFGLAPGDSSVYTIGTPRVKLADVEEYGRAVRQLCRGETVQYKGQELTLHWTPSPVPLWLAGDGPKLLQMAGRMADGVIVGNGATEQRIAFTNEHVETGARAAGRTADDLDLWYLVRTYVAPSRDEAIERLKFYLGIYAKIFFRHDMTKTGVSVPPDIAERIRAFQEEFDATQQYQPDGATGPLLDKHDLTEWIADQCLVAGPVDEIVDTFKRLDDAGGHNIFISLMLPDVMGGMEALRPIVEALGSNG